MRSCSGLRRPRHYPAALASDEGVAEQFAAMSNQHKLSLYACTGCTAVFPVEPLCSLTSVQSVASRAFKLRPGNRDWELFLIASCC
jgi:hypothetical protein